MSVESFITLGLCLTWKYQTRLKISVRDKHSSLLVLWLSDICVKRHLCEATFVRMTFAGSKLGEGERQSVR